MEQEGQQSQTLGMSYVFSWVLQHYQWDNSLVSIWTQNERPTDRQIVH